MQLSPDANLERIIAISCRILDNCSTILFFISKALHTSFILIGLQHPSDFFSHIHIPKLLLKNRHMDLKFQLMALAHPVNIPGDKKSLILYV